MENLINSSEIQQLEFSKPFTYRYIFIDIVLRFSILWIFTIITFNSWLFWIFQIIILPMIILTIVSYNENKISKILLKINNLPENTKIKLNVKGSAFSIIYAFFVIFIGTCVSYYLLSSLLFIWQVTFCFLIFLIYGLYIVVIYALSLSKFDNKKDVIIEEESNINLISVDENDKELIKQEVIISSFSRKIDSFTIESALLGALAFSCFLAILQIDNKVVPTLDILFKQFSLSIYGLMRFNQNNLFSFVNSIPENYHFIMALISIESITCSLFYLLVIVSRIRFHELLNIAEFEVKLAREFNNKEEEYFLLVEQNPTKKLKEKLEYYNNKINIILKGSGDYIEKLNSVINYMNKIRTIALFIFVLLISTAACIISIKLGLIFLVLYFISYFYSRIDELSRRKNFKSYFKGIIRK